MGSVDAADYPQARIANGQIQALLYLPDAKAGYYRGTRFDWSGVIGSLRYQGHEYYGPWFDRMDPAVHDFIYSGSEIIAGACSAITGPVEEFATGGKALGYDEAKVGGTFVQIGVGVLRKPDEPAYDHFRKYDIVDPGKWTVRKFADRLEFTQQVSDSSGYEYIYSKTVRLPPGKAEMVLEHRLRNTGRKAIESTAYNHNFLVLDKQPPGPDFLIEFPFPLRTRRPPVSRLAEIRGKRFVYLKPLRDKETVSVPLEGFGSTAADYNIRVENLRVGAGMRISGDRPLASQFLWSIRRVLSIEPYIGMKIQPGAEFQWNLTYTFYTLPQR